MTSVEECERLLLEGQSLNIVGLPGSGRSRHMNKLASRLRDSGWDVLEWNAADLRSRSRPEISEDLRTHAETAEMPVLLIDDFGELLVEDLGPWLERHLFAAIHEDPGSDGEYLRCVMATYPRDREIVSDTSVLRERSVPVYPERDDDHPLLEGRFGCTEPASMLSFCGGNQRLVDTGARDVHAERTAAERRAKDTAPMMVGHLDAEHQRRLRRVLTSPNGSPWRGYDADEALVPLVYRDKGAVPNQAKRPAVVRTHDFLHLLFAERWPDNDLRCSALRFRARCGNEPSPMWVDNFLSDVDQLDFGRLVRFLELAGVGGGLPKVRVLSRRTVGGRTVDPSRIAEALRRAGASERLLASIDWRLYRRPDAGVNLHDRQLVLERRGCAVSLPTAEIMLGQQPPGNESDMEVATFEHQAALNGWAVADRITF